MKYAIAFILIAAVAAATLIIFGGTRSAIPDVTPDRSEKSRPNDSLPPTLAPDPKALPNDLDKFIAAENAKAAPGIAAGDWINSEPLRLDDLRGRVVMVEFWTFGCYNCRNTLPAVKRLDAELRDQGLTVVGVHTPESDYERDLDSLRSTVDKLGIKYPVVTDVDYKTWDAYGVQAWPTVVILDKQGRTRFTHVGEGSYDSQERVIRALLGESK